MLNARARCLGPNEGEAEALTGLSVSTDEDAVKAVRISCLPPALSYLTTRHTRHTRHETQAQALVAKGVKQVVITLGSRGCLVVDKDSSHHVPAPKVKAVDTTGAGTRARVVSSCRVVSCRVVSCRVVSCRVVSCRVVSCASYVCCAC